MEESDAARKRLRSNDEDERGTVAKRLKEDLLDNFDDDDFGTKSNEDLFSFMKEFEEEISASVVTESGGIPAGDPSSTNLGYLLEASDDDLGIPAVPEETIGAGEEEVGFGFATESVRWEPDPFEPDYGDTSVFGFVELDYGDDQYVPLDGLFRYSDPESGYDEYSFRPGFLWEE